MALLRSLTPALHKLDQAVGRLSPSRDVLVEMRTPVYQAVLGPIADALANEPNVHVWYTSEYPERIQSLVPYGRFLFHPPLECRRFHAPLHPHPPPPPPP